MTIGEKLLRLRKNNNFSQEYIAEKTGVSRYTISNWEKDYSKPDIKSIKLLSKLYDIDWVYLITENIRKRPITFKDLSIYTNI